MTEEGGGERRWLRPLGLLALGLALAVGQPLVLIAVAFAFLTLAVAEVRIGSIVMGAAAFALAFAGDPSAALWYVERGWAILVAGWFAGVSLTWPERPFASRALGALGGASLWTAAVLASVNGWQTVERLVEARIRASAEATLEFMGTIGSGEGGAGLAEAVSQTVELQSTLFPALLGLGTFACLGVAWWLHVRLSEGSDTGLGAWRSFRFPDPLIWAFIAGLVLVLMAGWGVGWGRLGANLVVFMGALYAFRGVGVLLFLSGGVSVLSGLLVVLGLVLAGPLLFMGAMVVGMGDSWFDLRNRARSGDGPTGA